MMILNSQKYLNESEISHLMRVISRAPLRDRLLFTLAIKTGGRANEVLAIRKSDLDLAGGTIYLKGSKRGNAREIPINADIVTDLVEHTASLGPDDLIFDIQYRRFKALWDYYRPVRKTLHALRHTFAIQLYRVTKNLLLVQQALGHKSIENTMVYATYVDSDNELRKALA